MDTFPLFPELPPELQDMVWEFYLGPSPQPIAHYAQSRMVECYSNVPAGSSERFPRAELCRKAPPCGPSDPYPGVDLVATALQTTSRSRDAAIRLRPNLATLDSQNLVLLHEGINGSINHRLPPLHIDASTDLVILNDKDGRGLKIEHAEPTFEDSEARLRYLAFELPDAPRAGGITSIANYYSINSWYNFQVLYAVVDPEVVRQSLDKPWPADSNFWYHRLELEHYVAAYISSRIRPGPFLCGSWEYYEVPGEMIPRLGGLFEIIHTLDFMRRRYVDPEDRDSRRQEAIDRGDGTDESKSFRLMTWRDL